VSAAERGTAQRGRMSSAGRPVTISLLDKWLLLCRINRDRSLPACAVPVAIELLAHHNSQSGRCDPSRARIAGKIGVTARSVTTAISALIAAGYFARRLRGHHQTSLYVPIISEEPGARPGAKNSSSREDAFQSEDVKQLPGWKSASSETGRELPPNTSIEPMKGESPPAIAASLSADFGGQSRVIDAAKRDPRLYLASHGCTIDSYQPDPIGMPEWASKNAAPIANPIAPQTVEAIKDLWRRRGEKPKDFDATFRVYLRKRQEWAEQTRAKAGAAHDPQRWAGMMQRAGMIRAQ